MWLQKKTEQKNLNFYFFSRTWYPLILNAPVAHLSWNIQQRKELCYLFGENFVLIGPTVFLVDNRADEDKILPCIIDRAVEPICASGNSFVENIFYKIRLYDDLPRDHIWIFF